jgi:hypothetical protein
MAGYMPPTENQVGSARATSKPQAQRSGWHDAPEYRRLTSRSRRDSAIRRFAGFGIVR